MALIGNDLIRKYLSMQKFIDAIPGTLNVVSEENAAINERFNFELAFNLPLSKLFKAYLSVTLA